MTPATSRDLLLAWKGASLMDRRSLESDLRARAMPVRLPTEEAIQYANIDWLEEQHQEIANLKKANTRLEKRIAKLEKLLTAKVKTDSIPYVPGLGKTAA